MGFSGIEFIEGFLESCLSSQVQRRDLIRHVQDKSVDHQLFGRSDSETLSAYGTDLPLDRDEPINTRATERVRAREHHWFMITAKHISANIALEITEALQKKKKGYVTSNIQY